MSVEDQVETIKANAAFGAKYRQMVLRLAKLCNDIERERAFAALGPCMPHETWKALDDAATLVRDAEQKLYETVARDYSSEQ
jgi:hypothetical protein